MRLIITLLLLITFSAFSKTTLFGFELGGDYLTNFKIDKKALNELRSRSLCEVRQSKLSATDLLLVLDADYGEGTFDKYYDSIIQPKLDSLIVADIKTLNCKLKNVFQEDLVNATKTVTLNSYKDSINKDKAKFGFQTISQIFQKYPSPLIYEVEFRANFNSGIITWMDLAQVMVDQSNENIERIISSYKSKWHTVDYDFNGYNKHTFFNKNGDYCQIYFNKSNYGLPSRIDGLCRKSFVDDARLVIAESVSGVSVYKEIDRLIREEKVKETKKVEQFVL